MSNPYQAPSATVRDYRESGADAPYEPRIFSTQGRIGRLRYIVYSFVVQMIVIALAGIAAAVLIPALGGRDAAPGIIWPLMILIYVPVFATLLVMARRRLHDLNLSGWMVLLMLVPLVNAILGLVLMFWPGSKGGNRFGPPPAANGILVVLFGQDATGAHRHPGRRGHPGLPAVRGARPRRGRPAPAGPGEPALSERAAMKKAGNRRLFLCLHRRRAGGAAVPALVGAGAAPYFT